MKKSLGKYLLVIGLIVTAILLYIFLRPTEAKVVTSLFNRYPSQTQMLKCVMEGKIHYAISDGHADGYRVIYNQYGRLVAKEGGFYPHIEGNLEVDYNNCIELKK